VDFGSVGAPDGMGRVTFTIASTSPPRGNSCFEDDASTRVEELPRERGSRSTEPAPEGFPPPRCGGPGPGATCGWPCEITSTLPPTTAAPSYSPAPTDSKAPTPPPGSDGAASTTAGALLGFLGLLLA